MASEAAAAAANATAKATAKVDEAESIAHADDPDVCIVAGPSSMNADVEPSSEPAAHTITAEELALAMNADTPSASVSGSDDCEWEDAIELSPEGADAAAAGQKQAAQAARTDMWTRAYGYKFGRKLGEWSDGREEATVAPVDMNPVDVAALEAVVLATEHGEGGDSVQEARKLQRAILQSLEEQEQPVAAQNALAEQELPSQKDPGVKCSAAKRVRFESDQADELRLQRDVEKERSEQEPAVDADVAVVEKPGVQPAACAVAVCSSDEEAVHASSLEPVGEAANREAVGTFIEKAGTSQVLQLAAAPETDASRSMMPARDEAANAAGGAMHGGSGRDSVTVPEGSAPGAEQSLGPSDGTRKGVGPRIKLPSMKGAQQRYQLPVRTTQAGAAAGERDTRPPEQSAIFDVAMAGDQDERQTGVADGVEDWGFDWEEEDAELAEAVIADKAAAESSEGSPHQRRRMQNPEPSLALTLVSSHPDSQRPSQTAGRSDEVDAAISIPSAGAKEAGEEGRKGQDGAVEGAAGRGTQLVSKNGRVAEDVGATAATAAHEQQPGRAADMAFAHAAAVEQEQADEEVMQEEEEDDVVVYLMESDSAPGRAPAGVGAQAAATGEEGVAQATTSQVEGSGQDAHMHEPPSGNHADHGDDDVGALQLSVLKYALLFSSKSYPRLLVDRNYCFSVW